MIVTLPMLAMLFLWAAMALAQSSNILIPYGMGAGMQLMNRAMQPRPATAPTPTPRLPTVLKLVIGGWSVNSGTDSVGWQFRRR